MIDSYDMSQSVADGATVPIHYTARLNEAPARELSEDERIELDAMAEELSEGDEAAIERGKGRAEPKFEAVVGAPDRVATVAADIVDAFRAAA